VGEGPDANKHFQPQTKSLSRSRGSPRGRRPVAQNAGPSWFKPPAGKRSVRLSTALRHEYNQPLAAIRSIADNALKFPRTEVPTSEVSGNLSRINGRSTDGGIVEKPCCHSPQTWKPHRAGAAWHDLFPMRRCCCAGRAPRCGIASLRRRGVSGLLMSWRPDQARQVFVQSWSTCNRRLSGRLMQWWKTTARREADRVVVTVHRTGPGSTEQLPKVFRGRSSPPRGREGIGIGLLHRGQHQSGFLGGTDLSTNRPEGGACFTINRGPADPEAWRSRC